MQLPSTKKVHPDALAYPSHLASLAAPAYPRFSTPLCTIRTRLPTLGRAFLVNGTCHRLLAPNLSPTRSLLPRRRAVDRPCLPYPAQLPGISARPGPACSTAVGRDSPGVHSRPPGLLQARPPAPSKASVHPLCPPGRHARRPTREAELDQVLVLSLLTLHFPSGKALSPLRALATKSRGDPPVNARLLGGPFHWEI